MRIEHQDGQGNVIDVENVPDEPRVVNEQALHDKASAALAANATFLGLASPTNAQTLAQVKLLTRECNALIRLLLGALDDITGT